MNNTDNVNGLKEHIDARYADSLAYTNKKRKKQGKLEFKAVKLDKAVVSELRLMLWAVSNGISRNSLNDPLFDDFMKSLGTHLAPNRHTLQDEHLFVLDQLVLESIREKLKGVPCVSISSDGWRDNSRRDWINVVITWCGESPEKKTWKIFCVEPDLIFLPTSATAEAIAYLINQSVDSIVLFFLT
jgi:hypothetical protein